MIKKIFGFLSLLALVTGVTVSAGAGEFITPRQAIEKAADAAPAGISGTFDMQVLATGDKDGEIYLNSENDYRDQRNLTVVIRPDVAAAFAAKYGESAETFFKGKHILVTGEAKRVTIWFLCDDKRTDKYYYQTHVVLTDAGQVQIAK